MNKHFRLFLLIFLVVTILCSGCTETPTHKYSQYVEQPHINCIGTISDEQLNEISVPEADIYWFFLTNSHLWTINKSNIVYQTDLRTGESKEIGEYNYGQSLFQFTQTNDGSIWSSCAIEKNTTEEIGYLVRFDNENSRFEFEKEWENTGMFIKVIGYSDLLFVFRIVVSNDTHKYLVEKYDFSNNNCEIIVEKTIKDGKGSSIRSISIDGDNLYALTDKVANDTVFQLVRYDLNGKEQEIYDMPEYNEDFFKIHSGPLDIEVFNEYVSIKSLQNYSTIFQLQNNVAKRIYFTDNRQEAEKQVTETPIPLEVICDSAERNSPFTFFSLDNQIVFYDLNKQIFSSIVLNVGNKYPVTINNNNDVLFVENIDTQGNVKYYIGNIDSLLNQQ